MWDRDADESAPVGAARLRLAVACRVRGCRRHRSCRKTVGSWCSSSRRSHPGSGDPAELCVPRCAVAGVSLRPRHRRQRHLRRAAAAFAPIDARLGRRRRSSRQRVCPTAGDNSSWAPAVNADGSQVAFVTDATNLLASRRAGGGRLEQGDLLVAEFHLGQLRRVLDGPDLTAVPGAPRQSGRSRDTGQVIAFDTSAAARLRVEPTHHQWASFEHRNGGVHAPVVARRSRLRHGAAGTSTVHGVLRDGAQQRARLPSSRRRSRRRQPDSGSPVARALAASSSPPATRVRSTWSSRRRPFAATRPRSRSAGDGEDAPSCLGQ